MKKLLGAIAAAALLSTPAWAGGDKPHGSTAHQTTTQDPTSEQAGGSESGDFGTGGSGQMGDVPESMKGSEHKGKSGTTVMRSSDLKDASAEITGKVLKVQGSTIYLDQNGAAVPLTLSNKTKFDEGMSKKTIKEGQEIKASFSIKNNTKNMAESISMSGTGGGGSESGFEEGWPQQQPIDPGTGGSGDFGTGGSESGSDPSTGSGELDDMHRNGGLIQDGSKGPAEPLPAETY